MGISMDGHLSIRFNERGQFQRIIARTAEDSGFLSSEVVRSIKLNGWQVGGFGSSRLFSDASDDFLLTAFVSLCFTAACNAITCSRHNLNVGTLSWTARSRIFGWWYLPPRIYDNECEGYCGSTYNFRVKSIMTQTPC